MFVCSVFLTLRSENLINSLAKRRNMRVMDGYYRATCKYSTLAWSKCFRSLILAKNLG